MTISEQIKILCVRNNISVSELARRLGTSPQNFNGKMQRESLSVVDMERIAKVTGTIFRREFGVSNGETIGRNMENTTRTMMSSPCSLCRGAGHQAEEGGTECGHWSGFRACLSKAMKVRVSQFLRSQRRVPLWMA